MAWMPAYIAVQNLLSMISMRTVYGLGENFFLRTCNSTRSADTQRCFKTHLLAHILFNAV
jgi:hypothetical protein